MKKPQVAVSDYTQGRLEQILEQAKEDDASVTSVASNIKALKNELGFVNDQFPRFVSTKQEQEYIKQVVNEHQDELAQDFIEREPELRYKLELSPEEAFVEFQEFILGELSRLVAEKVINNHYRSLFESRYKAVFMKNSFHDFQRLYNKNKE